MLTIAVAATTPASERKATSWRPSESAFPISGIATIGKKVCPNLQQAEPGKGPIRQRSLPLVVEERVGEREPDSSEHYPTSQAPITSGTVRTEIASSSSQRILTGLFSRVG
jgi:hypothetical protein